ncbi:MAG TPA: DUF1697 domain-containing protein [Candidatus Eisenbacteria bacterium]|nr:DUF1697 domain-containing protein [Candidatus Eisenbacteria bacterium]
MSVLISMLRGVNVGAHNRIKMDDLRALYKSLKLEDPQTYVQSGNVIFRTKEKNLLQLSKKIQDAIEQKFKFRPEVILRTTDEFRSAIAASPFADRPELEPGKILVSFLAGAPPREAHTAFDRFKQYPEEVHLKGCELYIYFPNGAGQSNLPWSSLEKLLKVTGTARNLNSVRKMLEMAEEMEKS